MRNIYFMPESVIVRSPRIAYGERERTKQLQFSIINRTNPMMDDYHTGIRSADDISTWDEAVRNAARDAREGGWEELSSYPDVSNETIMRARRTGRIVVYSSRPIEDGNFVTPSRMQAQDYAGGGRIYSKEVAVDDVAWINVDEGQFARVKR